MNYFAVASAVFLALCSAYFSILGLAQIFHGSFISVIVMGIALEIGKFATALFMHRHWATLGFWRVYLSIATVILMVLTSAGIFGFLAKSSQSVAAPIAAEQTRLSYIETQLTNIETQRQRAEKQLQSLDSMVGIYTGQKSFEDARVGVRLYSRQKQQRAEAEQAIKTLNAEEQTLLQEKLGIEQKVQGIELEVGPAVYIAQALHGGKDIASVESAIRVVIFLIIFAFDPLAIALLIAAQKVSLSRTKQEPEAAVWTFEPDLNTLTQPAVETPVVEEPKIVEEVVDTQEKEVQTPIAEAKPKRHEWSDHMDAIRRSYAERDEKKAQARKVRIRRN